MQPASLHEFYLSRENRLNEELLEVISMTPNVVVVIFCGCSRIGKSSILNFIINHTIGSCQKEYNEPFRVLEGFEPCTMGANCYGPMSLRGLVAQHGINMRVVEDVNIFFVDTEGTESLGEKSRQQIRIILTLLNISTISVHVTPQALHNHELNEVIDGITKQSFIKKSLRSLGLTSNNLNLPSPCSLIHNTNLSLSYSTFSEGEQKYEDQSRRMLEMINAYITREHINLDNDARINFIAGSDFNGAIDGDPNDIKLKMFITQIKKMVEYFASVIISRPRENNIDGRNVVENIRTIFGFFESIPNLDDVAQIHEAWIRIAENICEKHLREKTHEKANQLTSGRTMDINECRKIIFDDREATTTIKGTFTPGLLEFCEHMSSNYVSLAINRYVEILRNALRSLLIESIDAFRNQTLSDININRIVESDIRTIRRFRYLDEVPERYTNETFANEKWNAVVEENRSIVEYIEESNHNSLSNIKSLFISGIQGRIRSILPTNTCEHVMNECVRVCDLDIRGYFRRVYESSDTLEDFDASVRSNESIIDTICINNIERLHLSEQKRQILHDNLCRTISNIKDEYRHILRRSSDRIEEARRRDQQRYEHQMNELQMERMRREEIRQSTVPREEESISHTISNLLGDFLGSFSKSFFLSNRNDNVKTTKSTSSTSQLEEAVNDVIRGRYGNGEERKKKLKEAGFDYETVQSRVNEKKRNNEF